MIVCVCHRVSDRDIARTVRGGCSSFEGLQQALGVSTACGRCRSCATEVFNQQRCGAAVVPDLAHAAGHTTAAAPASLPVVRWHRPLVRPQGHAVAHPLGHSSGLSAAPTPGRSVSHSVSHSPGNSHGKPPAASAAG